MTEGKTEILFLFANFPFNSSNQNSNREAQVIPESSKRYEGSEQKNPIDQYDKVVTLRTFSDAEGQE